VVYSEYQYLRGRVDEGLALYEQGLKLDPFSLDRNVGFGYALLNVHRDAAAIQQFLKTLELDSSYATTQLWLAEAYGYSGSYDLSVHEYLKWLDKSLVIGRASTARTSLERAYARSGWLGFWQEELALAEEEADRPGTVWRAPYGRYCGPYYMARRYARIGIATAP